MKLSKTFCLLIFMIIPAMLYAGEKGNILVYEGISDSNYQTHIVYSKRDKSYVWIHLIRKSPRRTVNSWKCKVIKGSTFKGRDAKGNQVTFGVHPTFTYKKGNYNPRTGKYQKGIPRPPYRTFLRGYHQDFRFVK